MPLSENSLGIKKTLYPKTIIKASARIEIKSPALQNLCIHAFEIMNMLIVCDKKLFWKLNVQSETL